MAGAAIKTSTTGGEPRETMAALGMSIWLLAILIVMLAGAAVGFLTSNFLFVYTSVGLALAVGFAVSAFLPAEPMTRPVGRTARTETDMLAIVALVAAGVAVVPFLAIPFGHAARRRISRQGGRGAGIALAAIIAGYSEVFIAVAVILWIWNFAEQAH